MIWKQATRSDSNWPQKRKRIWKDKFGHFFFFFWTFYVNNPILSFTERKCTAFIVPKWWNYETRTLSLNNSLNDFTFQINRIIQELEEYKYDNTTSVLKSKGDQVASARAILTDLEKQVCELANTRLRLNEESAKGEAALAQELCKAAQYDRDLKVRRKYSSLTHIY